MLEMGPSVFYSKHHKLYPYRRTNLSSIIIDISETARYSLCSIFMFTSFSFYLAYARTSQRTRTVSIMKSIHGRYINNNVHSSSCDMPIDFILFEPKSEYVDECQYEFQTYFMKIRPVGVALFLADRQTDERADRRDGANSRLSPLFCERA